MKYDFYFILKTAIFFLTYWSCKKNGLIRKIRLNSKFRTPQPGWQTITIHILPNISKTKSNLTMKFGQLIKLIKRNIFLQKPWEKWGRETRSRPVFVSEKSLYEVKLSGLQFSFNIFRNFAYNKNKLHKVLDYLSKDMLNFDFLKKGSVNRFPTTFYK